MVRRARRVPPVAGRVRVGAVVVVVAKATRLDALRVPGRPSSSRGAEGDPQESE